MEPEQPDQSQPEADEAATGDISDTPPAAAFDPAPHFQFLRSREERKLGGVAGGLAAATGGGATAGGYGPPSPPPGAPGGPGGFGPDVDHGHVGAVGPSRRVPLHRPRRRRADNLRTDLTHR